MAQGRKPKKKQNQEVVDLINALKEKKGFHSEMELANWLEVQPTYLSRWKNNGLPRYVQILINEIIKS